MTERRSTVEVCHWAKRALQLSVVLGLMAGCAADGAVDADGDKGIFKDAVDKARQADLNDALSVGAKWAADELNDMLSIDLGPFHIAPALQAAEVYALPDFAEDDLTVEDLNDLHTGLAERFGNNHLTTEVNRIRTEYLGNNPHGHRFYGETGFRLSAGFEHDWNIDWSVVTDQLDRSRYMGFAVGGEVEGSVVAPYTTELQAHRRGNALALLAKSFKDEKCEGRNVGVGFVIPECYDQFEAMHPGQMFSLRGEGRSGLYFVESAPALIEAELIPGLNWNVWVTASVKYNLDVKELAVETARLEGDDLVVDVRFRDIEDITDVLVTVEDRWVVRRGLNGLIPDQLGIELTSDVQEKISNFVARGFQRLLNRKLDLIKGRAGFYNTPDAALSLARVRFHLDERYAEGEWCRESCEESDALAVALSHAVHGDARLAQVLYNQGHPGLTIEHDLSLSGIEAGWDVGLEVPTLGLEFMAAHDEREVEVTLQERDVVRSLVGSYLRDRRGLFWWGHDYARVGLAGQMYRIDQRNPWSGAHMYLSTIDKDGTMDRDRLVDHLDGVILALTDANTQAALDAAGVSLTEQMDQLYSYWCEVSGRDGSSMGAGTDLSCAETLLERPNSCSDEVLARIRDRDGEHLEGFVRRQCRLHATRDRAMSAFLGSGPVRGLSDQDHDLAERAARLLLASHTVHEDGAFSGPHMRTMLDLRLDDGALAALMRFTGAQLTEKMKNYLVAAGAHRSDTAAGRANAQAIVEAENENELRRIARAWDEFRAEYTLYQEEEQIDVPGLGVIGQRGFVFLPHARDEHPSPYTDLMAESFALRRARLVTEFTDKLVGSTPFITDGLLEELDIGFPSEVRVDQVLIYSLLALLPADHRDLRFQVELLDHSWLRRGTEDLYETAGYGAIQSDRGGPVHLRGPAVEHFDMGSFDMLSFVRNQLR